MRIVWLSSCFCALAALAGMGLSSCVAQNPDYCNPASPACFLPDGGVLPDLATGTGEDGPTIADLRRPPPPPDLRPACKDPGDCPSDVCEPDGNCPAPDDVIYVDNQNGACFGSHTGTQQDPLCTTTEGVDKARASDKRLIHVAGSVAHYDGVQLKDQSVGIFGPGGYASPPARLEGDLLLRTPAVAVSGGAQVVLFGLELAAGAADLATCTATNATVPSLSIYRGRVHQGPANGITTQHCKLTLDRTVVGANAAIGIVGTQDSELVLVNSLVAQNFGIGIDAQQARLDMRFSTVVQNGGRSDNGAIDCGPEGTDGRSIDASLIVYNSSGQFGSQLSAGCKLTNSAFEEPAWTNGTGNRLLATPDFVRNTLYHLARTVPTLSCCIDQLDKTEARGLAVDLDGTPRPQGMLWDIGSFEAK